jgi:hypothetical protein
MFILILIFLVIVWGKGGVLGLELVLVVWFLGGAGVGGLGGEVVVLFGVLAWGVVVA